VPHLPAMRERNMGFVTMRPLLQGLLTDKRGDRTTLPPDDPKRGPTFDDAYRRLQHLEAELGPELQPLTTAAIRFALADPLTPSVILSMNTEAQVEAALAAAAAPPLPADIQTRVHALNAASSV
jgi:aryl-alcohol dehydrogenase-like predicted oxidoreductase